MASPRERNAEEELWEGQGTSSTEAEPLRSFEHAYRNYRTPLFAYLVQMTGNREQAEEIVQETFLKAWKAWSKGKKPEQVRAWLYRIATHTFTDVYRSERRRGRFKTLSLQVVSEETLLNTLTPDPQELYGTREVVRDALAHLPSQDRAVLVLVELECLTYQQIGLRLHISPATVVRHLKRARQQFRCYYRALVQQSEENPISSGCKQEEENA